MKEHFVGFSLKEAIPLLGVERSQALTVKEEARFFKTSSIRVAPREIISSRPLYCIQGGGGFFIFFRKNYLSLE